jgi:hypothetical protein
MSSPVQRNDVSRNGWPARATIPRKAKTKPQATPHALRARTLECSPAWLVRHQARDGGSEAVAGGDAVNDRDALAGQRPLHPRLHRAEFSDGHQIQRRTIAREMPGVRLVF